ncbi:glycerol-3-phosphate dehydrogenase [Nematocida major]|uniref:glycerol-3-phosphate dehydrogenase n=1 Tax=Nematocida major TaxID=1912982 RepID=UPI002007A24B|nr:glycerol-3-phosphate dehydrogenase [Nematocida major]KAH9386606.1 glycerol-3-phosphate dehydrogenase [Nematocida major]
MSLIRGLCLTALTGAVVAQQILKKEDERKYIRKYNKKVPLSWMPESRGETIKKAQEQKYDMVIIGGGSAGAGCLLDAATRGYSVLLLERGDFSSGTSSKSTKLIHGGIRYLEKAIKELDYRQLSLVVEGLRERRSFLNLAPYLTREVGILLPIRHKVTVPYFWLGTKVYDWLSGGLGIQKSYFINKNQVKRAVPAIDYRKIAGGMVYFDGQMDDSRVNTMLVETGVYYGGHALNYAEVAELTKENGKIVGLSFKDRETGKVHAVRCSGVINATGPYSDGIRLLDNPQAKRIIAPSAGIHLVVPKSYTGKFGMLNPNTKNGSVLFLIPWHGFSILGTTDSSVRGLKTPLATESDVKYLVGEMGEFVDRSLVPKAKNILSAWGGIRPLAMDPSAGKDSTCIVRSHLIEQSESGLVTIAGGKWTSYREMAEETVTEAAKIFSLPGRECVTKYVRVIGSHGYTRNLSTEIEKEFGLPQDVAAHLVSTYGDRARKVCLYANGDYRKIDPKHPYLMAEIPYTIDHEHVRKISDYIGRRSMFAYFNVRHAHASVMGISKEFASYMKWTSPQKASAEKEAYEYFDTMGHALLMRMEQKEKKVEDFQEKLKGICTKSGCAHSPMQALVEKTFGKSALRMMNFGRSRKYISMYDVVKTVKAHEEML